MGEVPLYDGRFGEASLVKVSVLFALARTRRETVTHTGMYMYSPHIHTVEFDPFIKSQLASRN